MLPFANQPVTRKRTESWNMYLEMPRGKQKRGRDNDVVVQETMEPLLEPNVQVDHKLAHWASCSRTDFTGVFTIHSTSTSTTFVISTSLLLASGPSLGYIFQLSVRFLVICGLQIGKSVFLHHC